MASNRKGLFNTKPITSFFTQNESTSQGQPNSSNRQNFSSSQKRRQETRTSIEPEARRKPSQSNNDEPSTREEALKMPCELPIQFRIPPSSPHDISNAVENKLEDWEIYDLITNLYQPTKRDLEGRYVVQGNKRYTFIFLS